MLVHLYPVLYHYTRKYVVMEIIRRKGVNCHCTKPGSTGGGWYAHISLTLTFIFFLYMYVCVPCNKQNIGRNTETNAFLSTSLLV